MTAGVVSNRPMIASVPAMFADEPVLKPNATLKNKRAHGDTGTQTHRMISTLPTRTILGDSPAASAGQRDRECHELLGNEGVRNGDVSTQWDGATQQRNGRGAHVGRGAVEHVARPDRPNDEIGTVSDLGVVLAAIVQLPVPGHDRLRALLGEHHVRRAGGGVWLNALERGAGDDVLTDRNDPPRHAGVSTGTWAANDRVRTR